MIITYVRPEGSAANRAAPEKVGLDARAFRQPTLERFAESGWQVTLECVRSGHTEPSPPGAQSEDATIDGLPVASTTLEWCVLVAR